MTSLVTVQFPVAMDSTSKIEVLGRNIWRGDNNDVYKGTKYMINVAYREKRIYFRCVKHLEI